MKEDFVKMKTKIFLILILLIASLLRFYHLGQMPSGITNDEAGYIYNAYSISQTLKDANGRFLPLSINLDNPFSPVPIYINAVFLKIFGLSIFTGRFIYAALGVGSVLLLFLLAKQLFKNNKIALMSASVLAISPWHLHISRSAYEAGVALFFFLLAFLVFLKNVEKGNINWSLPFFLLAFYSYHATKIYFLFFIPILILTHQDLFKRKKELILFVVGSAMIILSFFYVGKRQQAFGRAEQFFFMDTSAASRMVDEEREKSSAPFILRQIFNNKPLFFLREIRENYLSAFSPQYLFLYGETSGLGGIYGTFFRGEMYIIELLFLVLGISTLCQKYKSVRGVIFFSLLAAPLTTILSKEATYVMRAVMMIPFLYLLVGLGIFSFISFIQKYPPSARKAAIIFFITWYLFLLASYLYHYHFRYSIYGAESWFRSRRDLFSLIREQESDYQRINIAGVSRMFIFQYGVFAKVDPSEIQQAWSGPVPRRLRKITFLGVCIESDESPTEFLPPKTLYIVPDHCHKEATPSATIRDFGEPLRTVWKIYSTAED
jgi:4-amino-4-deoxy-L-arabinose transferase-like glycosyltransferase